MCLFSLLGKKTKVPKTSLTCPRFLSGEVGTHYPGHLKTLVPPTPSGVIPAASHSLPPAARGHRPGSWSCAQRPRGARKASHLSQAGAEVAGAAAVGRPAGRRAGEGWPPLSAARWLRGQRRGGTGLGKPPSPGPGPASPTQCPGNLGTFHCLRRFTKQIVPVTMGLRRDADNWGVRTRAARAGPGGARCRLPGACLLGSVTRNSAPPGAARGAERSAPVPPRAALGELSAQC